MKRLRNVESRVRRSKILLEFHKGKIKKMDCRNFRRGSGEGLSRIYKRCQFSDARHPRNSKQDKLNPLKLYTT